MSRIPAFLLRHTATIQPYQGTWGSLGTATVVKVFISEHLTGGDDATNDRIAQVTLYAAPDAVLPAGSKVTLPDGRVGYISASVRHDSNNLGVPDHVEAAVRIGVVFGPTFGETVIILRRTLSGTDRYNNPRYATTEIAVPGCSVRNTGTSEDLADQRDQISDTIEVIFPPGTTVSATDGLRVRGLRYEIDGTPDPRTSTVTGSSPGVRVTAKRVTG